jgi:hypothetical protein
MLWLALLTVGFLVALLLRAPSKKPDADRGPEPRVPASSVQRAAANPDEVEIEVADPRELGITPTPGANAASGPTDEEELVRTLGVIWQTEPERALALAEEGDRRFGESPRAVERRLYEIKSLVKLGRIGRARTRAERYLASYPPGPMTDEVERLTGVHRRPEPEPAR